MYKALRGMKDNLPPVSAAWQSLERVAIDIFNKYGYSEIRTPLLEEKKLFVKSIGGQTDIVTKEMFSFVDRGEREVVMRPEGTAPIVRAYLEASLHKIEPFQKLYYIGPMFRAERPQAGRLRQFHQIGAEVIGSLNPAVDAEIISLLSSILDTAGIKDYRIKLNNLGCRDDKIRLSKILKEYFSDKNKILCEDCVKRTDKNPMRILDCKKDGCRNVAKGALKAVDFLCDSCKAHHNSVREYLKATPAGARCVEDPYIVRGLDYYTGTVFEVSHPALGAQDAIGAGGRYDNLVEDMGGPSLGAVGFALGIERMLIAREKDHTISKDAHNPLEVYIVTLGQAAQKAGFGILNELRSAGISGDINYEAASLKSQMRAADKLKARFTLIIGDNELNKSEAVLKNMSNAQQHTIKLTDLITSIKQKLTADS